MKIGVADTMFARVDMFKIVRKALDDSMEPGIKLERYTVPGVKDLPIACKKLFGKGCDICLALGMPGPMPIDKTCAHEASQGLISLQLAENKHVLEVFVHLDEAKNEKELYEITKNRAYGHAMNAIASIKRENSLHKFAGHGVRQGTEDIGPLIQ